jgi:hypothetical protein
MIKEYKSATSGISNASTKGYEEMNRYNQIMHEPIENLVANMENLSRPLSSGQSMYGIKQLKKERAMTAHNKNVSYRNAVSGLIKIAQSAYHIGGHQKNTLSSATN